MVCVACLVLLRSVHIIPTIYSFFAETSEYRVILDFEDSFIRYLHTLTLPRSNTGNTYPDVTSQLF